MTIYENMCNVLKDKNVNKKIRNMTKFILGEFQRKSIEKDKSVSDEVAVQIMKKIVKNNNETIKLCKQREGTDITSIIELNDLLDTLIPKQATNLEILEFISKVDFTQFNSNMQVIGLVIKHFNGNVDGKLVKEILLKM